MNAPANIKSGTKTKIAIHHQALSRSCKRFTVTASAATKIENNTAKKRIAPTMPTGSLGQGVGPPFS